MTVTKPPPNVTPEAALTAQCIFRFVDVYPNQNKLAVNNGAPGFSSRSINSIRHQHKREEIRDSK